MFINNERVRATSFPRVAIMENRFEMSPLPLLRRRVSHTFFWRRAMTVARICNGGSDTIMIGLKDYAVAFERFLVYAVE